MMLTKEFCRCYCTLVKKTRGIVEKGNLETVERDSDNRQALVKVADALKLRVERTMFGAEKAQKRWKLEQ